MRLGVCAQVFYHMRFRDAVRTAADFGFEAIELPVDASSPFIDLDAALAGEYRQICAVLREHGLTLSALSNHQEGQLLLGPYGGDTDPIFRGDVEAKIAYAQSRLRNTAELARRLEVDVVCGFTGCEDYSRWFPWPLEDGYERMASTFRERMLPLLDAYASLGVRFAHECHPRQFAYNLETAELALKAVDQHPALTFNLDPANLVLAGMDPVFFVAELGERIVHVHAKDAERVPHRIARSGLLAHGNWSRRDRGFRFRVPGWGELSFKRIISELQLAGYTGVLAIEHEDPTMSQIEGLRQAVAHLAPIVLREPAGGRWW